MVNDNFFVDVSPEMQLYKILQRQSYDIGTALAEFVDNSIQSFVDQNKAIKSIDGSDASLKIGIRIDTKSEQIIIEDNAGGINRENFQKAIRMGHEKGTVPNSESLSVYGIGMKSSAIWFSNKWSIETSALGSRENLKATFDLDYLLKSDRTKIKVTSESEETNKHYTKITINDCLRDLEDPNKFFEDFVLPYLQETFYKFKDVYIEIVHDDLLLQTEKAYVTEPSPLVYPPVDKNGEKTSDVPVKWRRKLDFIHAGKNVKGFVMIMDRGAYHGPGVRLLRNRRVIQGTQGGNRQNKPTVLLDTSNKYAAQRIYGEITLNEFSVNFMKTGFDENMDSLYRAIKSELSARPPEVMEDFIQQATWYRKNKSTSGGTSKTGKPRPENKIPLSTELSEKLAQLKFKKLYRLYESLCRVSLVNDPVLAYVAAWTLLESLATYLDKKTGHAFDNFYNDKINIFTKDKAKRAEYRTPIRDIHEKGNMNKHSSTYATINAQQLANDFQTIEKFLIHCAERAVKLES